MATASLPIKTTYSFELTPLQIDFEQNVAQNLEDVTKAMARTEGPYEPSIVVLAEGEQNSVVTHKIAALTQAAAQGILAAVNSNGSLTLLNPSRMNGSNIFKIHGLLQIDGNKAVPAIAFFEHYQGLDAIKIAAKDNDDKVPGSSQLKNLRSELNAADDSLTFYKDSEQMPTTGHSVYMGTETYVSPYGPNASTDTSRDKMWDEIRKARENPFGL